MVGLASYDGGGKQTWRGWQWNQIAARIPKYMRRDAVVAYLVGPDDLDRRAAVSKGFRNRNLIAIDMIHGHVEAVRGAGGVALKGSLVDLVAMWPRNLQLSGIVADFTCGLMNGAADLLVAVLKSYAMKRGTVLSVNMMRGRDPVSNGYRQSIADCIENADVDNCAGLEITTKALIKLGVVEKYADPKKHRGFHWLLGMVRDITDAIEGHTGIDTVGGIPMMSAVLNQCDPRYYSYKSQTQIFDSVVTTFPITTNSDEPGMRPTREMMDHMHSLNKSRFDYQSYVAKFARLKTLRENAPEFLPQS